MQHLIFLEFSRIIKLTTLFCPTIFFYTFSFGCCSLIFLIFSNINCVPESQAKIHSKSNLLYEKLGEINMKSEDY